MGEGGIMKVMAHNESLQIPGKGEALRRIFQDEVLMGVLKVGLEDYIKLLQSDVTDPTGEQVETYPYLKRAIFSARLLEKVVREGTILSLPIVDNRTTTDRRGRVISKTLLGGRLENDGNEKPNIFVRVQKSSKATDEEIVKDRSFAGETPEDIIVKRGIKITPTVLSISTRYAKMLPDGKVVILDSAGIEFSIGENGEIQDINGVNFVGGTPHKTDSILPDDFDKSKIDPTTLHALDMLTTF